MQRTSRATPHVYAATSRALAVSLVINLLLLAVETAAAWSAHSSGCSRTPPTRRSISPPMR